MVYLSKRYILGTIRRIYTILFYRRAIRETWANTTEFNYPIFYQMHAKLFGKYLNINDKDWKDYIEVNPYSKIGLQNVSCARKLQYNLLPIIKRNERTSLQISTTFYLTCV